MIVRLSTAFAWLVLAGIFAVADVSADPASSAQSAWSPFPLSVTGAPADAREKRGREVFHERCAACHGPIPSEIFGPRFLPAMPGTQALRTRYRGAVPAELELRTDLSRELVAAVVRKGIGSMPFFRPTEISDDDLEALSSYLTRKIRQ